MPVAARPNLPPPRASPQAHHQGDRGARHLCVCVAAVSVFDDSFRYLNLSSAPILGSGSSKRSWRSDG
jgi:hypothetical protein